ESVFSTSLYLGIICSRITFITMLAGQKAALVLACPYEWVGYHNVCYYLLGQQEQGSWDWSQEQCLTHGASLALVAPLIDEG
uniref:C-type lectin domain-containing protein n=1 Tax=Anas platyrhynchos platyrhynchos TaxID=8840 RepID=A0A493T8V9_ANAPP